MKIYNKKTFAFGVFSAALGVLNAVTAALRGIDAAGIVLVAVLLFVGAGAMMRGLSQKMAREDKLEERDERNRLVELKSKSAAFGLMLALLVAGKVAGTQALTAIGTGLAAALSVSMLAELGAFYYYEKRT